MSGLCWPSSLQNLEKKKSLLWKGSSSNSPLRVTTVQKYPGSARSRGLHVLLLDHGNMGRSCRCTSNRKRFSRKHMGDMDTGLLSSDVHPSRWTHKWRQPGIFRAGKKRGKQLGHQAISKYTNMTIRTNIPAPAPSSPDRQVCALCYRSSLFHLDAGLHAALHVKEPTLHGGPGWRYCLHLHSRREKMAGALISGGWRHTTGLGISPLDETLSTGGVALRHSDSPKVTVTVTDLTRRS